MAVLQAEDYVDLVKLTLNHLGRHKWTELATDLTDHVAMNRLMRKERVRFDNGKSIDLNVQVAHSGAAKHSGMYAQDTVNVVNTMQKGNIPWRHTETDWAFEEHEVDLNGGASEIIDLVKTKRIASMISLAELFETTFWGKPTDSADTTTPFGVKYWIVSNSSTGFNGGNPSGFTAGAGDLSSTTYPRWSNYTGQYTNVTYDDLVGMMKTGARKTNFRSPVKGIPLDKRGSMRREFFTNEAKLQLFEKYARDQNDNIGWDIAAEFDSISFNRIPVHYVPHLDADSTNPVYQIDWSVFYLVFLRQWYMKQTGPIRAPFQHLVHQVFIDCTWNTRCTNRRKLAVYTTS